MHLEKNRPVVDSTDNLGIIHDALQASIGAYGDTEEQRFAWTKAAQDAYEAVADAQNTGRPSVLFLSLSQLEDIVITYGLERTDQPQMQAGIDETLRAINQLNALPSNEA
jgi:hypothetical protein